MRNGLCVLVAVSLAAVSTSSGRLNAAGGRQQSAASSPAPSAHRAVLDKYCVTCHNQRLKTAGLTLDTLDVSQVPDRAEVWEKVARKLRAGAMPPPGSPRPDQPTYDAFATYLETSIDRAAATRPNPGRTETFHRLNRAEYQNAIRDLLAVDVDVAPLLPADAADQHGFDNMAGVLSVSPALLERYIVAARKISRLAIGLPPGRSIDSYNVPLNLLQDDRVSDDLPFGSRGGIAVRHNFPVDGEYTIKIRLQTNYVGYVRGIDEPHRLELRLDGVRIRQFTVGGDGKGRAAPASYEGNIFGDPEWENYMQHADEDLAVRIPVRSGPRLVAVSFPRELWDAEGVLQPRESGFALAVNAVPDGNPALGRIEIEGPHEISGAGDTPSRRRIFICRPDSHATPEAESLRSRPRDRIAGQASGGGAPRKVNNADACARAILTTLARRAYRRPVTEDDVRTLLEFYREGRSDGGFEAGIQAALERLLAAPDFVFRIERDPAGIARGTVYRLGDLELASRLSFLIWSSIPDDELLEAAARGRLKDPKVLGLQVRRMLADPRSHALVENFVGQWLYLRNIKTAYPDPGEFPDFDDSLREAFEQETELFVESQLREDQSVVDLLSANYTFVNERLARHYGIRGVYGSSFRRVTFGSDDPRGGLLGHGSLLTVTSYPNRTSPVLRGKWLLENILGTPTPPPPPNVPSLPERGEGGKPASVRERLEQHRKNPQCAVCHSQMDPLGFGLENFDAIGAWRTVGEGRAPIDPSGTLPGGATFTGVAGLREVLLARREQFVRTVAEKLLMYALGRGIEYFDLPVTRKIVRDAASSGYRWSSVILGIVNSAPFQMRTSDPGEATAPSATVASAR